MFSLLMHILISIQLSHEEEYPFVWAMIYYPLVVVMFFINCFADVAPHYDGEEKSDVKILFVLLLLEL